MLCYHSRSDETRATVMRAWHCQLALTVMVVVAHEGTCANTLNDAPIDFLVAEACMVLCGYTAICRTRANTGARALLSELRKLFTDFSTSGNTFFLCSKGTLCQLKLEGRKGLAIPQTQSIALREALAAAPFWHHDTRLK